MVPVVSAQGQGWCLRRMLVVGLRRRWWRDGRKGVGWHAALAVNYVVASESRLCRGPLETVIRGSPL